MLAASVAHRLVVEPEVTGQNVLSSSGAEEVTSAQEVTSAFSITQMSVNETVDDAALLVSIFRSLPLDCWMRCSGPDLTVKG